MRDFLIIYVNGKRHEIRGIRAFQSLSDFLRHDLGLIGTKVVCAEGDCGSCTVFLGRPDTDLNRDRIAYRTVCSCIQFLYQLDCTHIVTVEGLKYDGALNPVQEAMVTCQGSQCGFCTPGFVVSMCAMFEERKAASMEDVKRACVGNLCRCTGYDSIMRAGAVVDPATMRPLNEMYRAAEIVNDLRAHQNESVSVASDGKSFFKAINIHEACRYRSDHPGCMIIAGGTDVGVQMNKCLRDPKEILSIGGVGEMKRISLEQGVIVAGALTSISDLEQTCRDSLPEYSRLLYWFGSPPIKNAGTIGGNIGNGSPIADSMPAMYVLNVEIELTGVGGSRRVNINEFYTGYKKTVAKADELITAVHIPLPDAGDIFRLYKVSKRKDLDISAFTAAIWMGLSGGKIGEARIAYGGVGPNIIRLGGTEEFFVGKMLDEETIAAAGEIARGEIAPISDVRGSAEFRNLLGRNILRKFLAEVVPGGSGNGNGNGKHEMQPRRHEEREGRREG
jgi:xanthine dehydrogenase small subunit